MKLSHNRKAKGMGRHLRRCIGMLLCLALLTGSMAGAQPAAGAEQGIASEAADTAATYMMEGATLTHEVLSAWGGGYNAQVTITNTGSGTIENWGIEMLSAEGTGIDSIWNAVIQKESRQGGSICYDISNPGWGRDIAPGASVSFGYQGRTDTSFGGIHAPLGCSLAGKQHEAQQGDYRLWYRIVEDWQSGGIVEATVQNLTEKDMENWKLSFAWQDVQIEEIWDASLTEGEGGKYHVKNAGYNYTVPAQGSVAFRMKVEADMGEMPYPQDGILSYDSGEAGNTPVPEEPAQSPEPSTPATSPAVAATEPAAETPEPEETEEMRRWNRTMLHMDDAGVKKALTEGEGSVKVALLDSGVDEMEGIPVAGRVSLVPGEEEMTELYEDATGHGTAVASVMAYHYKDEEDILEEKIEEYNEQFYAGEEEALSGEEETGSLPEDDMQEAQAEEEEDTEEEGTGLGDLITMAQARFEGINPEMELYSVRVLDEYNEAPADRVIEGIRWARENGIRIINISFGTTKDYEELHKEIKKAYKEGILVIAATGNDGRKQYPAAYKEVLGVGSVDCTGQVQECCKEDAGIELSAPGEGVLSVGSFGVETEAAGTSMAAGEVTAIASILWQQNPALSNKFIRSLLAAGANPCDGSRGYGIVDPAKSLAIREDFLEAYEEAADVDFAEAGEGTEPTVPGKKEEAASQDVDALLAEADIEKEEEEPATTEALVRACWGGKTHLNLVKNAAKKRGLQGNTLKLLKIGARLQDGMLCNLNDKKKFPTWHGYFKKVEGDTEIGDANYVAGYMYLTRLAKEINEKGDYELGSDRLWDSVTDKKNKDIYMQGVITENGINYDDSDKEQRIENLLPKNRKFYTSADDVPLSSWRNIFRSRMADVDGKGDPYPANQEDVLNAEPVMATSEASVSTEAAMEAHTEQALVVYGMGLHTLTDTFAHSCRAAKLSNGKVEWQIMSQAREGVLGEGQEEKYNDSTKVVPNRLAAAAQAATNALNHIQYKQKKKEKKLEIESSKVTDFYIEKESQNIVQLKNYICKKDGK